MQERLGWNFLFQNMQSVGQPNWKSQLGSESSTFLGHGEMLDAAKLIPAEPQLIFHEHSTVFSLNTLLLESMAPIPTLAEDSEPRLPGYMLVCACDFID